jgi:hypothetical protein
MSLFLSRVKRWPNPQLWAKAGPELRRDDGEQA